MVRTRNCGRPHIMSFQRVAPLEPVGTHVGPHCDVLSSQPPVVGNSDDR